jgi:hypothetical protein
MRPFKLNSDGQHEYTTGELDAFDLATYDIEHDAAHYGANARSLSYEVRRLSVRVMALEAALREIEPVLDRAVSAACAKSPPDYAETLDALDAVRNALEGK